jgi:hypothetical protein
VNLSCVKDMQYFKIGSHWLLRERQLLAFFRSTNFQRLKPVDLDSMSFDHLTSTAMGRAWPKLEQLILSHSNFPRGTGDRMIGE